MNARPLMRTAADFGYRVREERERQGITQAVLAARADVSIRWLSNFERGKSPRAELIKVVHVARALGMAFALTEETRPALSEAQQRLLTSIRETLPSTETPPALARTEAAAGDQMIPRQAKASLHGMRDSTRRMAESMSSGEPLSPSAMMAMQSMLETIGRNVAEAQPASQQNEGDNGDEA